MKTLFLLGFLFCSISAVAGNIYECQEMGVISEVGAPAIVHEVRVEEIGRQELGNPNHHYDYKVPTEITVNVLRGNRLIERETLHADAFVQGVDYAIDQVSPNFRFWLYMDGMDQCGMDFISSRTGRLKRVNLTCRWVAE